MKPIHTSKIEKAVEDFLINFPFFSDLDEDELEVFAVYLDIYQVEENEFLFQGIGDVHHTGDRGRTSYYYLTPMENVIERSDGPQE